MASEKIPPCSYCMYSISEMILPRLLPCSHIFCEMCLVGQLGTYGSITCPTCSQVLSDGVRVDSLPLAYDTELSCDGYLRKGEPSHGECTKKESGFQSHNEEQNPTTSNVRSSYSAMTQFSRCNAFLCSKCLKKSQSLHEGDHIADTVTEELCNLRQDVTNKQGEITHLEDSLTELKATLQAQYHTQLQQMQQTSERHLEELQLKYDELKSELKNSCFQLDSRIMSCEESNLTATKNQDTGGGNLDKNPPSTSPVEEARLTYLPSAENSPLPKDLQLIMKVAERRWDVNSLAIMSGKVFVSYDGGVDVLTGGIPQPFIQLEENVFGLRAYKSLLYMVTRPNTNPAYLRIYDEAGAEVNTWSLHWSVKYFDVSKDMICTPEEYYKRITVYSLTGNIIRFISFDINESTVPYACITPDKCIVFTNGSVVSCVNVGTGRPKWTNSGLAKPLAVTIDSTGRIYVASGEFTTDLQISILSPDTGEALGDLGCSSLPKSRTSDLHITPNDSEMFICRHHEGAFYHYKIATD